MRVLVVGASGFIGRHLVRYLAGAGDNTVAGTFYSRAPGDDGNSWYRVDVTDPAGLGRVFHAVRPEIVVHLAALADVGTAERKSQRATAVNVSGTTLVAGLAEQHQARLVYVSTEYVFSGDTGYYAEDATPHPTTQYGRTKLQAEREVERLCSRWSVLRTSIVYGWPELGQRNYASRLIASLREGSICSARVDVYRTPIYITHLVAGIATLATAGRRGIFHVVDRDWVSMYDFARAIAQAFGLDTDLIAPTEASTGKTDARPPDLLGLNSTHTMQVLGLPHFGLADGISAFHADAPQFHDIV